MTKHILDVVPWDFRQVLKVSWAVSSWSMLKMISGRGILYIFLVVRSYVSTKLLSINKINCILWPGRSVDLTFYCIVVVFVSEDSYLHLHWHLYLSNIWIFICICIFNMPVFVLYFIIFCSSTAMLVCRLPTSYWGEGEDLSWGANRIF